MFSFIWHTFFFDPVYNSLIFFINVLPNGDVGLAIIFTTIVVKIILFPISYKASKMQVLMRELEPKIKAIKEKFTDRQEQAQEMMKMYKEAGVNPFAGILPIFIQIPILIALFLSVYGGGGGEELPAVNVSILYNFVPNPETISMIFLGIQDITARSLPIAAIAGVLQYIQASMTIPKPKPKAKDAKPNLKDDFTRSMQMQMRYVMPAIVFIFAYTISAAIALYFAVSAFTAIVQEMLVKRNRQKDELPDKV